MIETYELAAMSAGLSQSLIRRLVMWAARWLIGFAIVAAVVHFWPSASWLWWAAAAIAALSLASLVVMHALVQHRIAAVQSSAAAVDRLAEQLAAGASSAE